MNSPDPNWTPDPQLLAAYFDGELEGRDDLADLRTRLEAWLEAHPEAAEAHAEVRRLERLWQDTTPAEPTAVAWNDLVDRIDQGRKAASAVGTRRRPWLTAGIIAASIALMVGAAYGTWRAFLPPMDQNKQVVVVPQPQPPEPNDGEVLVVATASEVTILRIEGADDEAVVVGTMPVSGPLDLADSGEVCINCKCPRVVIRQEAPYRPMVWARND